MRLLSIVGIGVSVLLLGACSEKVVSGTGTANNSSMAGNTATTSTTSSTSTSSSISDADKNLSQQKINENLKSGNATIEVSQ